MKTKTALILLLSLIVIAMGSYIAGGYISPVDIDKVSVGDTVYIKLGTSFNGNGIVKTFDKTTKMATIEIKDGSGRLVMLNIHAGWIDSIVTDVPEVADPLIDLKQKVIDLQTENNNLKQTISTQKTYIDKINSDMKTIAKIAITY